MESIKKTEMEQLLEEDEYYNPKFSGFSKFFHRLKSKITVKYSHFDFSHLGLLFGVVSSLMFSLCSLVVKLLSEMPSTELAIFRFLGLLLLTLPCLLYRDDPVFPKEKITYLLIRGILGTFALLCQFYAFQHLPLGDASVIIFSVPIAVSIFAKIFLNEECSMFHCFVIVMTLIGVCLVTQPPYIFTSNRAKYEKSEWMGVLAAFGSILFASNVYILLRMLKSLHHTVIIFNFSLVSLFITLPLILYTGDFCLPPFGYKRWMIVLLAVLSFLGQILKTKALQMEEAGPIAIARSADVIFAYLWQFLFFQEVPDLFTIIGTLLITVCIIGLGFRKWLKNRTNEKAGSNQVDQCVSEEQTELSQ